MGKYNEGGKIVKPKFDVVTVSIDFALYDINNGHTCDAYTHIISIHI